MSTSTLTLSEINKALPQVKPIALNTVDDALYAFARNKLSDGVMTQDLLDEEERRNDKLIEAWMESRVKGITAEAALVSNN